MVFRGEEESSMTGQMTHLEEITDHPGGTYENSTVGAALERGIVSVHSKVCYVSEGAYKVNYSIFELGQHEEGNWAQMDSHADTGVGGINMAVVC